MMSEPCWIKSYSNNSVLTSIRHFMGRTNYQVFFLLLCFMFSADTLCLMAKKEKDKYKLVFHDEFNLPDGNIPDTTKWSVPKREPYRWARWISSGKDVAFIKNGALVCRAIPNMLKNDTAAMRTGAICSKGKFYFQYGKVEVRMRTNSLAGNFPAVWLLPENGGKPFRYGEVDIVEFFGGDNIARQTVHSHRSFMVLKQKKQVAFSTRVKKNKWHIYSLEWTPKLLTFFVDGKLVGSCLKSTDIQQLKEGQWTFDRPYYLLLNQSVGDASFNIPDTSQTYETMFDWIRVYQKVR